MKKEYTVEQRAETRWLLTFTEPNAKGETVVIELTKCFDNELKNSLPKLWKKNGHTNRVLETYWHIDTCVTDKNGYSFIRYNPQITKDMRKINFDWMFEATEENKNKLIDEVYRLATA